MEKTIVLLLLWMTLAGPLDSNHFVLDKRSKRCQFMRSHGMNGAVCHGLNLEAVPTNLRSNVEILDASYNRIRELYKTTFSNYGYLKFLYLQDNMIMYIENGTFSSLTYLEVIDLSANSLDAIPRELLTLPSLRKLYMDNNRLTASAGLLNPPRSQSLEFLSLAKCHLNQFPPLDVYPVLKNLNLSANEIRALSTRHLAPMCLLESLDVTGNPLFQDTRQDGACDCVTVESWIHIRQINMPNNFNCSTNKYSARQGDLCTNITFPEESVELYNSCMDVMRAQQEIAETRTTWILVVVILTCSLLTVFLVLFWIHKRNRRKSALDKKMYDNGDVAEKMVTSDVDS